VTEPSFSPRPVILMLTGSEQILEIGRRRFLDVSIILSVVHLMDVRWTSFNNIEVPTLILGNFLCHFPNCYKWWRYSRLIGIRNRCRVSLSIPNAWHRLWEISSQSPPVPEPRIRFSQTRKWAGVTNVRFVASLLMEHSSLELRQAAIQQVVYRDHL